MHRNACLVAVAALASATLVVLGGCSADAQAAAPTPLLASAFTSPTVAMPAPQAPFDETPITPAETVGAWSKN